MNWQSVRNMLRSSQRRVRLRQQKIGRRRLMAETLEDRRLLTLLGIAPGDDYPRITYNQTGVLTYNAAAKTLSIDATALSFRESLAHPTRTITSRTAARLRTQYPG
jgi:hypothetical protein